MNIILAAAIDSCKAHPWECSEYRRHLVPIDGEPLLHRTVRQLRSIRWTQRPLICGNYDVPGACSSPPANHTFERNVLLDCAHLWQGRDAVILYGDVVWNDKQLRQAKKAIDKIRGSNPTTVLFLVREPNERTPWVEGLGIYIPWVRGNDVYNASKGAGILGLRYIRHHHPIPNHVLSTVDGILWDIDTIESYEAWTKANRSKQLHLSISAPEMERPLSNTSAIREQVSQEPTSGNRDLTSNQDRKNAPAEKSSMEWKPTGSTMPHGDVPAIDGSIRERVKEGKAVVSTATKTQAASTTREE